MNTDKARSAVLLVEFQNQWTQKGFYNRLIKKQLDKRSVIKNTRALVKEARGLGMKIIHAPLVLDPEDKKGWLAFVTFGLVFTRGTKKARISEGFYKKGDLIVEGRYAFDAFVGSNLENILIENEFDNIFVCGFTTDQCIAKTMDAMADKKFNAFLVFDCTATINNFLQKRAEKKFADKIISSVSVQKELKTLTL